MIDYQQGYLLSQKAIGVFRCQILPLTLFYSSMTIIFIDHILTNTIIQIFYRQLVSMDFLSDSEPDYIQQSNSDVHKLEIAWRNMRNRHEGDLPLMDNSKYTTKNIDTNDITSKLETVQKQLAKARQNTHVLMKKLSEAEEQLQMKQFEHNKERKARKQAQQQLQEVKSLLSKHTIQQKNNKENYTKNESINRTLQIKQKEIDRLCLRLKSLELDNQKQQKTIITLQQTNSNYHKELVQVHNSVKETYLTKQSNSVELMQLKEANQTIQRLVTLLKNTEQYRGIAGIMADTKQLHFLKNIPKKLKVNQIKQGTVKKSKECNCTAAKIDQKLLWTPQAAYKIMLEMKIKYESLTEDCIEEVLFSLNQIWLARQDTHLKRLKDVHEGEIKKLKKKAEEKYDEVLAKKTIERLKKELRGKNGATSKNKRKYSQDGDTVMKQLRNAGQYQDEIRIKQKQIRLLQERVRLLEGQCQSSDHSIYMEGALWAIEKTLKELEVNEEDMRDFETEFRNRIQGDLSQDEWIRCFKQFFETISQINNSLTQRLFTMRTSTIAKVRTHKA